MIQLVIDEKIVDAQLMAGKKIPVRFITMFNGKKIEKRFPDDFTPEQQSVMKQIYDLAVYGSEVGNRVFKCSNDGLAVTITGVERITPVVDGVVPLPADHQIVLEFTRHGFEAVTVPILIGMNETFNEGHLEALDAIGIEVTGTGSEFGVIGFTGDISIRLIADANDSFIDLGDFKGGQVTFTK